MDKFGVGPDKITDVQALIGDSVDNIPGVPGIGPKTAAKLINEFGTFEELLAKKDQISNVRIKNLIHDHEESAKISHQLVILKNDLELPIQIENLKDFDDSPKLNDFFKKYEFKSLIRTSAHETKPHAAKKDIEFKSLIKTPEIIKYLQSLQSERTLAIDLETDSLDVNQANIIGISLSNANEAYYIPFKSPENELSSKDQTKILKELNLLCEDPSILKIFHNAKYDSVILKRFHVNPVSFQDTLVMSFFINNGLTKHNLEDLYYYYFGEEKEKFKDVIKNESKRNYKDFSEVPLQAATNYAAHDAYATHKLYEALQQQICATAVRGVRVRLNVPANNDSHFVGFASRSFYRALLKAGVEIHEFQPGLLHAKILTVDGQAALVGSPNLDRRSFDLNYENSMMLADPVTVGEIVEKQELFLKASLAVSRKKVESWSISRRVLINAVGMMAPLL